MKIKTIKNLTFHRNGVHSDSFYSCYIESPLKYGYWATFETDVTGTLIDISKCRVITPDQPTEKWRGDEFGIALNSFFRDNFDNNKTCIYDFCEQINQVN